jgi:hypothetical protein
MAVKLSVHPARIDEAFNEEKFTFAAVASALPMASAQAIVIGHRTQIASGPGSVNTCQGPFTSMVRPGFLWSLK